MFSSRSLGVFQHERGLEDVLSCAFELWAYVWVERMLWMSYRRVIIKGSE
jgi:hypothetical protein